MKHHKLRSIYDIVRRKYMRKTLLLSCVAATALFAGGEAYANDELIKMQKDREADWVMPAGITPTTASRR